MDLKETILETLKEIENFQEEQIEEISINKPSSNCNDKEFLKALRERLLVLFEGLQSPNTDNLEIKLDVTLNFLEYLLVKIEEKLNE